MTWACVESCLRALKMLPGTFGQWLTLVLVVSSSTISISRVVGQYKGLSLSLSLLLLLLLFLLPLLLLFLTHSHFFFLSISHFVLHNSNNIKRRKDKRKEPYTIHTVHTRVYELRLYRRFVSFEARITKRGASNFFALLSFLFVSVCVCARALSFCAL